MDSIARITIPEDLDAGSNPPPSAEAGSPALLLSRSGKCVRFKHIGRKAGECVVRHAEPATSAVAMSSYRLLVQRFLAVDGQRIVPFARFGKKPPPVGTPL